MIQASSAMADLDVGPHGTRTLHNGSTIIFIKPSNNYFHQAFKKNLLWWGVQFFRLDKMILLFIWDLRALPDICLERDNFLLCSTILHHFLNIFSLFLKF